ncbi:MAG: glycosyltransferase family 2 protein [Chloroflexota bacterium]
MNQVLFWMAAFIIFYTFFGYPILVRLLVPYFARPIRHANITPTVTLLVAAYNEAEFIAEKIKNSLTLDYPPDQFSIVIVTDGSDDDTVDIVRRYKGQGVRLYHQPERRGKIAATNRVMPLIDSEIVIFTDANTLLETGTIRAIIRNFADSTVGGVAGEKRVLGGNEGLYWRYESYLKRCDSALSSVMGAAGELFAIRKSLFQPPEPDALIEDFLMSMRLVDQGWRVVYEPEAIARERPTSHTASDWHRRTRIATGGFQSIGRLLPLLNPWRGRIAWQYWSHRVLRWAVTPFLFPIIYILNLSLIDQPLYQFLWLAQTLFYCIALVGFFRDRLGKRKGIPQIIFYFCLTNAAALIGFWRYITNTQPVTWVKAR